jgi:hypothetical protein
MENILSEFQRLVKQNAEQIREDSIDAEYFVGLEEGLLSALDLLEEVIENSDTKISICSYCKNRGCEGFHKHYSHSTFASLLN